MLSNMLLFVLLCYQIEEKYGWWRAVFIFVWSAVGGEKHGLLGVTCRLNQVNRGQLHLV